MGLSTPAKQCHGRAGLTQHEFKSLNFTKGAIKISLTIASNTQIEALVLETFGNFWYFGKQAPVVQKVDNAIHRINHYPADSVVCFVKVYPLDSDLSSG